MFRRLAISLTALVLVATFAACAAKSPKTRIVWKKIDGTVATREELDQAVAACNEGNRAKTGVDTGRFATNEWAAKMLECMKEKGYVRVEEPLP